MLINSFIHIKGVGKKTESSLWKQGILTWEDLLSDQNKVKLSKLLKKRAVETIKESSQRLTVYDEAYFKYFPRKDNWRLYKEFEEYSAFVDIETTGLMEEDSITVLGIYNGQEYKSFIKGRNIEEAEEEMLKYKLLITYNGACFDLPYIHRLFPDTKDRHIHIDLRYPLRKLGLRGGLKNIEKILGITRSGDTEGLGGYEAVLLWNAYKNGSEQALDLLVKYNSEDCINLKWLMQYAYESMKNKTFVL